MFFTPVVKTGLRAAACGLLLVALPLTACAAKAKQVPTQMERAGTLPSSGVIVLRSGLAWMDENSALFQIAQQNLAPLLAKRGLSVAAVNPSVLAPLPNTPLNRKEESPKGLEARQKPDPSAGDSTAAEAKAKELAQEGKLRPLKLQKYTTPERDADLPASVQQVRPLDPYAPLFALSQQEGRPFMRRGGAIPGRIPAELRTTDPAVAGYAMVIRFSAVRPVSASYSGLSGIGAGTGSLLAASSVGGIGSLGYGAPASPGSAARPGGPGGSDLDYARGYRGTSPVDRDFFNRDSDMNARDYQLRNSPPPESATPPSPVDMGGRPGGSPYPSEVWDLPGPDRVPPYPEQAPATTSPGGKPSSAIMIPGGAAGYALEMECYDLAPAKTGGVPKRVWRVVVHQQAQNPDMGEALAGMIARAMDVKTAPAKN